MSVIVTLYFDIDRKSFAMLSRIWPDYDSLQILLRIDKDVVDITLSMFLHFLCPRSLFIITFHDNDIHP